MSIGDFIGRVGDNIGNAPPEAWFSLAQALSGARDPLQGLAQGAAGFGQQIAQSKKKASLAEALKGATGGFTPQQQAFLGALEPEQQANIVGEQLFKDNKQHGPFAGTGFDASAANIIVQGQMNPALRASPEYAIAYANLTQPKVVKDADGRDLLYRPEVPKGIQPPTSSQPTGFAPPGGLVQPPARPAPVAPPQSVGATVPAGPPMQMADMEAAPQSTAPVVSAVPGGGTTTAIPGTGKTPTEAQFKSGDFYTRMRGAEDVLSNPAAQEKFTDQSNWLARQGGEATEWLQGDEAQTYYTAAADFIAALLRKDSGAQITKPEFALYGPIYIPELGDGPSRLAYKAAARARAREAIKSGLLPEQIVKTERALADNPSPTFAKKYPVPPQDAINRLKMARDREAFDEVFGPGAADRYLGGK